MYIRKYRIIVDSKGSSVDVSQFRCTFDIEKAIQEEPQYAQITIFNISDELENVIITKETRVIVEAGYENGAYGLIYSGNVVQAFRGRDDGTDTRLTLVCQDGDTYLNASFMANSLSAGAKSDDIIQHCMSGGSVGIQKGNISPDLSKQKLSRGKVMFGLTKNILRKVARGNQAKYYVDGDKLNVIKAADVEKNIAFELNPNTGLIGTPTQNEDGVSGECLLNPQIRLNSLLYIDADLVESQTATADSKAKNLSKNGVYRIIQIRYTGDSLGDDWKIAFEAVSQPGSVPNLLKNGATNPWR